MRSMLRTAILVTAMSALPVAAFALAPGVRPAAAKAPVKAATHSVRGTVRAIDATSLVIAREEGPGHVVRAEPCDQAAGQPGCGSRVSVRYHVEGTSHVATAVVGPHEQNGRPRPAAAKQAPRKPAR